MTATSYRLLTAAASTASASCEPQGGPGRLKRARGGSSLWSLVSQASGGGHGRAQPQKLWPLLLSACLMFPVGASCEELNWSVGGYVGQYYDTEPAGIVKGDGSFQNQYLVALTASRTVWRHDTLPLALEIDGMIGHQFGQATLQEFAIAPVLRWSGFPWNDTLPTSFRFGPVGYSYTTVVSPLEQNASGEGSRHLNFLLAEVTFSRSPARSSEVFLRLHHRCSAYDVLNNYGANGEDFLALGYRRFF